MNASRSVAKVLTRGPAVAARTATFWFVLTLLAWPLSASVIAAPLSLPSKNEPAWAPYVASGRLAYDRERFGEAERQLQEALRLVRAQATIAGELAIVDALVNLATVQVELGKFQSAEDLLLQATNLADSASTRGTTVHALALQGLGSLYLRLSRFNEARELCDRAVEMMNNIVLLEPLAKRAAALAQACRAQLAEGPDAEMQAMYERAYDYAEGAALSALEASRIRNALAGTYLYSEPTKIRPIFERSIYECERMAGPNSYCEAETRSAWVPYLFADRRFGEAEQELRKSLAWTQAKFGNYHYRAGMVMRLLANVLLAQEKREEALSTADGAYDVLVRAFGGDHAQIASLLGFRGFLLATLGRAEEADRDYERAVQMTERLFGPTHARLAIELRAWADLKEWVGKPEEAARLNARADKIQPHVPERRTPAPAGK